MKIRIRKYPAPTERPNNRKIIRLKGSSNKNKAKDGSKKHKSAFDEGAQAGVSLVGMSRQAYMRARTGADNVP